MDSILFIGTNKSGASWEAIKAAKELQFRTIVVTDKEKLAAQREEFAEIDEIKWMDLSRLDEMKKYINELKKDNYKIKGILSFIDPYVSTAAKLSEEYGISAFSTKAIEEMEDKIQTKERLKYSSIISPYDVISGNTKVSSLVDKINQSFPVIVKPSRSTGSKGVFRVDNKTDLKKKITYLQKKEPRLPVIVEPYLEGVQYVVEVIVKKKQPYILAVIHQEIRDNDPFIVTGYTTLPERHKDPAIKEVVWSVVNMFQMENGTFHIEMRHVNNEWKLIEVNPRISGGAMNRIIYHYSGVNPALETLKLYLGQDIDVAKKRESFIHTYYVTVQTAGSVLKVTGKEAALESEGVREVYIKPRKGMTIRYPSSMGHRYAYVMAAGNNIEQAKENAIVAAKKIKFHIVPL
ncbi:ATP-grasp domain-containing protein [Alteribacillus iranensis]|uniref:Biotin carboxylase n=1 Tax=Alteribacillus iranensis TaxID=930128 RepID=A0A1I1ZFZ0_9BACI|nr:ATP-grasp domain-containing protein [Alteribacillus iranensis]SFE30502.1 Biotin carboxylase [Alteribacillus iranensis]